uniref:C2H2-type domain-containing protein n=1 Tax=Lepeophtheirus salmonis TaxID=72036 RepID=A0A0K2UF76_LEPSM
MDIRELLQNKAKFGSISQDSKESIFQTIEYFLNDNLGRYSSFSISDPKRSDLVSTSQFLISQLGLLHDILPGPKQAHLTCGTCKKHFSNPILLKFHIKFKHRLRPVLPCLQCPEKTHRFINRSDLVAHTRIFHPPLVLEPSSSPLIQRTLSCPFCSQSTPSFSSLFKHIATHHTQSETSCLTCKRRNRYLSFTAWKFIRCVSPCCKCDIGFASFLELETHLLKSHFKLSERCWDCKKNKRLIGFQFKDGAKCGDCKRIFHLKDIKSHDCVTSHCQKRNAVSTTLLKIPCINCSAVFESQKSYSTHLKSSHGLAQHHFCYICGLSYNSKYYLENHIQSVHEKVRPWRCATCGKELGCKASLDNHMNSVHLKLKKYSCETCGLKFGVKQRLTLHIKSVHLKIKDQICSFCDAVYAHRTTLKDHIRHTHQEQPRVKRFMCDKCHKCFISNSALQGHIKFVHYGIRDFPCRLCGKAFGTTNMRRKHERLTHDPNIKHRNPGAKFDIPCDICHKMFGRKATMERHKLFVHEERRDFNCELCHRSFQQRCDLTKHNSKYHLSNLS